MKKVLQELAGRLDYRIKKIRALLQVVFDRNMCQV